MAFLAKATARCVFPTPGGPSTRTLVASATKARLASSFTCRSSMEGLEGEVELVQRPLEGEVDHLGPGGKIAFPPDRYLGAQQLFQHLRVGQLLVGGNVQGVVQDFHRLLEPETLQVLGGPVPGRSPGASHSGQLVHVQGAEHPPRPLGPAPPPLPGVAGHPPGQSCPLAGQDEAGSRLLGPGMDRDALIASPDPPPCPTAVPPERRGPPPSSGPRIASPPS